MILNRHVHRSGQTLFVLHIGLGLVGSAIETASINQSTDVEQLQYHKVDWTDNTSFSTLISSVADCIQEELSSDTLEHVIHIIWSAGKVGFNATKEDCDKEMHYFEACVEDLSGIFDSSSIEMHFHFISSAGGLFEGQRFISQSAQPAAKRPYGFFKLAQEEHLIRRQASFSSLTIYRPSSIYSAHNVSGRKGLLAVLIDLGLKNKEITITGSEDTKRDYVLDRDIGKFVAAQIFNRKKGQTETHFLIQGKSSTILEIRLLLERIMNRKLILRFSTVDQNNADMSFTSSLKPDGFETSPLPTNLKSLYLNLLAR